MGKKKQLIHLFWYEVVFVMLAKQRTLLEQRFTGMLSYKLPLSKELINLRISTKKRTKPTFHITYERLLTFVGFLFK